MTPFVDDKKGESYLMELFGELVFMFYFLYLALDIYFVLWTYALCDMYLVFEVGMNLYVVWTYLFLIWQLSLLSLCGICVCLCIVSYSLLIQPFATYFGGWRYFWMDGG